MMKRVSKTILEYFIKKSYSLNELDLKLLEFINYRNGFFIEAGANNGLKQSNTLYFEKYRGWKGLLIEAIPFLAEQCRINRPNCIVENCALVSTQYQGQTIEMYYNDLMSFASGAFENEVAEKKHLESAVKFLDGKAAFKTPVVAKTLSSVLMSYRIEQIDLLSLDVEGYEVEVLGGIDFQQHAPKFILLETWHNKKNDIETLMSPYYNQLAVLNTNAKFSDILYGLR